MSESHNQAVTAAIALLAETFPECFSVYEGRPRPLKIGIHLDILAAVNGALTPLELSKALGAYCANSAYLRSSREGAQRIDLNGNPARLAARKASKPTRSEPPASRRLSLADLKAAALARKTVC